MKNYSVATFENLGGESIVFESGLTFEQAETLAETLLKNSFGVEIIDDDVDSMEPIVLVKTNKG